jgi:hypothetical protein
MCPTKSGLSINIQHVFAPAFSPPTKFAGIREKEDFAVIGTLEATQENTAKKKSHDSSSVRTLFPPPPPADAHARRSPLARSRTRTRTRRRRRRRRLPFPSQRVRPPTMATVEGDKIEVRFITLSLLLVVGGMGSRSRISPNLLARGTC